MQSAPAATFDEAYYQRFYFDKKTSVVDPAHMDRLGTFVGAYLHYLRVPVRRVLDVGCGIGLWQGLIARHFPQASYQGVELSDYRAIATVGSAAPWWIAPPTRRLTWSSARACCPTSARPTCAARWPTWGA